MAPQQAWQVGSVASNDTCIDWLSLYTVRPHWLRVLWQRSLHYACKYVEHCLGDVDSNYSSNEFVGLHHVMQEPPPNIHALLSTLLLFGATQSVSLFAWNQTLIVTLLPVQCSHQARQQHDRSLSSKWHCQELDDIHLLKGSNSLPFLVRD